MCGIAGFFSPELKQIEANERIEKMLQAIAHRGPDARGNWWYNGIMLGHNRLSIIDLSREADQPMIYQDLAIVFNGEVYNYIEIRKELLQKGYLFTTQSDTEVVMAAYLEWGEDCVKRFVGMWAFVLFDKQKKQLFVSRDRFGIKPLYFIIEGNEFYFASEYKALKAAPVFSNKLNLNQVSRGLQLGWLCYNDETYFEKIEALPAANSMRIDVAEGQIGKVVVYRYWDVYTDEKSGLTFEDKVEAFRELFLNSVDIHMRSDVPVATCLSGGLDSSAIVSAVQKLHPETSYKSFSIYYDGDGEVDERPFIKEVINKYPVIEPFYKKPTDEEVREEFHKAAYHADVPTGGSSFISQYFLMKLISDNGIKVVLDGQGSDEYLAGYMHSYYRLVADMIRKINLSHAVSTTNLVASNISLQGKNKMIHFSKSLLTAFSSEQSLYQFEYNSYYPFLFNQRNHSIPFYLSDVPGTKLDRFLYNLTFHTSLPSLLHHEDRNSMAFGIESRVPFLDHRLVEFAFSLSNTDRIDGIETKRIMRKALNDILPAAVANRKDKKGFVTPGEVKWLRGPLKHLTDINYANLPFLKKELVARLMEAYRKGDNSKAVLIWRISSLNYWLQNFA